MPVLILHYREIWLKGRNRGFFVQKLKEAVAQALEGLPAERPEHEDHRMFVPVRSHADALLAVERLRKVPGIAYFAIAEQTEPQMDAIVETGCRLMANETFRTFRVRARRSRKSLPFRSADIERSLGAAIGRQSVATGKEVKVDLAHAEATCFVEVTATRALIYHQKIPGSGGLPTGTAGKLVCLLSGGFDSAVAAYKIIKRGVRLAFVHFYGAPRSRRGRQSSDRARAGQGLDALSGAEPTVSRPVYRYSERDRRWRAGVVPHPALPAIHVAHRPAAGLPGRCARPRYRRQHWAGRLANAAQHAGCGSRGLLARPSPARGRRQTGDFGLWRAG